MHNLMISVKNSVIYYIKNRDEINKKKKILNKPVVEGV